MGTAKRRRRRPEPVAVDQRASAAGLRAVAMFEATKGVVVLLLGLGLLTLLHRDLEEAAENLLLHLHINPDRKLAQIFLDAASRTTDGRLWGLAAVAVAYATVRFTEAWGLWHRRVWAEWFALLSGALYLPWEILKTSQRPNWWHITLLAGNVVIVLYMLYVRFLAYRPLAGEQA
jgi:uncharacterized membrane protein (DUF2068 family)